MSCWLCESSDKPIVSNKSPIREMLGYLYPELLPKIPEVLDLCSSCFLQLSTYYNFKLSYVMELKTEASEDEDNDDSKDLSEDCSNTTCCVCSKKKHLQDVCLVKECSHDEEDLSYVSADLINSYFPQKKLQMSENPVACSRCTGLLKGMHDYHQKCSVRIVISSVNTDDDEMDEGNQDYSVSIKREAATLGDGAHLYKTNVFSVSTTNEDSSDGNLQLYEEETMGNHFMFGNQSPIEGEAADTKPSKSVKLADTKCDFQPITTSEGTMYQCDRCHYKCNRQDNMRRHIFIRHVKRNMMQKCPHCPLQTISVETLTDHIKKKHSKFTAVRVFRCYICDFKAESFSKLQRHSETKHMVNKPSSTAFTCKLCNFVTSRSKYLQKHVRYNHTDTVVFLNCELCEYRARRKDSLKQHMDHVHKDHPSMRESELEYYKCDICSFQTKRKNNLKRHVDCVHVEEDKKACYKCGACSYSCTRKDSLKRHVECQHSGKPVVFNCNMCPYSVETFDYLQKHIKHVHTEKCEDDETANS